MGDSVMILLDIINYLAMSFENENNKNVWKKAFKNVINHWLLDWKSMSPRPYKKYEWAFRAFDPPTPPPPLQGISFF